MAADASPADAYTDRSGKFRHIFGEVIKKSNYEDLKPPQTSGEGNFICAGRKYIAYAGTSGGGPIFVFAQNKPGRGMRDRPGIKVHSGKVWDFEFHPFVDNMLGSCGDDCKAVLTQFPVDENGISEDVTDTVQTFSGHSKKVTHIRFSKVTDVVATGSFDATVKLWNIETGSEVSSFNTKGSIQDVQFNKQSSMIVASSKNKAKELFTFDPRTPDESAGTMPGFEGGKSVKVTFMDRMGWVAATGFTKTAKRQLKIWDLRDLSKTVYSQNLDSASSILVPRWDDACGVLYTAGKGEGTISYYEIVNDATKVWYINNYRNTTPQRGGCWTPKSAMDVWSCEVQRYYKLTKDTIIPIRFSVPRKAGKDIFQEDIYPDAFGHKKAIDVGAYLGGENAEQVTMSLDPEKRVDDDGTTATFKVKKSYAELESDVSALREKYTALKARLAEADSTYEPSDDEKTEE